MSKGKSYTLFELIGNWAERTYVADWQYQAGKAQHRCVYILECRGFYKIGKTANLNARLKNLQTTNPFEVRIAHVVFTNDHTQVESALHEIFAENRTVGEWFNLGLRDLAKIKSMSVQEILNAAKHLSATEPIQPHTPPGQMSFFDGES
jgi:hypothetical protein